MSSGGGGVCEFALWELLPQSHMLRVCVDKWRVNDLLRLRNGEEAVRGMSTLLGSTSGVVVGAPVLGVESGVAAGEVWGGWGCGIRWRSDWRRGWRRWSTL